MKELKPKVHKPVNPTLGAVVREVQSNVGPQDHGEQRQIGYRGQILDQIHLQDQGTGGLPAEDI